jgi:hypothetical protein
MVGHLERARRPAEDEPDERERGEAGCGAFQNFTSGAFSAPAVVALNVSFGLKPQIFAAITDGNERHLTL